MSKGRLNSAHGCHGSGDRTAGMCGEEARVTLAGVKGGNLLGVAGSSLTGVAHSSVSTLAAWPVAAHRYDTLAAALRWAASELCACNNRRTVKVRVQF